jgi:hypothetical protein
MRGSARSYHLLKHLSPRHAITLLGIAWTPVPAAVRSDMTSYLEALHVVDASRMVELPPEAAPRRGPGWIGRLAGRLRLDGEARARGPGRSLQKRAAVERLAQSFARLVESGSYDVVLLKGASIETVLNGCDSLPFVVDPGDANSRRHLDSLRHAPLLEWPSLLRHSREVRQSEMRVVRRTPHLAFVSCRDRDAFVGRHGGGKVVPNGVDLDSWTRRREPASGSRLVFTGVMDYRPNADAAMFLVDEIAPRIRALVPDLSVAIVGRSPSPALLERARRCPGVICTGLVDDVRPFLEEATVFVAPLRFASGTQNKVLEALAMEVPVVCTSTVAEGLHFDDFKDPPVRVADRAGPFARAVVELLSSQRERARLAVEGREFVRERFDWAGSARLLEALCEEAVSAFPRAPRVAPGGVRDSPARIGAISGGSQS